MRDIARPVVCLKLTVFLRLFYFNWWKKKKNEGDIFFFAFSYSRENEIKMCWWISDDGEREGSLPSASSFPSLFFVFFLLVVVYTHLCGGGRYSWSSFLHYFVGQTGRYVRWSFFFFLFELVQTFFPQNLKWCHPHRDLSRPHKFDFISFQNCWSQFVFSHFVRGDWLDLIRRICVDIFYVFLSFYVVHFHSHTGL